MNLLLSLATWGPQNNSQMTCKHSFFNTLPTNQEQYWRGKEWRDNLYRPSPKTYNINLLKMVSMIIVQYFSARRSCTGERFFSAHTLQRGEQASFILEKDAVDWWALRGPHRGAEGKAEGKGQKARNAPWAGQQPNPVSTFKLKPKVLCAHEWTSWESKQSELCSQPKFSQFALFPAFSLHAVKHTRARCTALESLRLC